MPRFGLHEFSRPDYRGSLPERDPNNAIWPRISMLAKMLHDMSWEEEPDESTEVTQEELDDAKAQAESDMLGYVPNGDDESTRASELMKGYRPSASTPTRSPDMDRQKAMAEGTLPEQNEDKFKKKLERDASDGDFNMEDYPELFAETEDSKKAMADYLDRLDWINNAQSSMQGYRPLPTR